MQDSPQESSTRPTPRTLTRSRDRMLGGVAGGLADYFAVDPTVVRLLLVLSALVSGGIVVIAYIVLWIIMPEAPAGAEGVASTASEGTVEAARDRGDSAMLLGVVLLAAGGLLLLNQLQFFDWFGWGLHRFWWPALLIIAGVALIASRRR